MLFRSAVAPDGEAFVTGVSAVGATGAATGAATGRLTGVGAPAAGVRAGIAFVAGLGRTGAAFDADAGDAFGAGAGLAGAGVSAGDGNALPTARGPAGAAIRFTSYSGGMAGGTARVAMRAIAAKCRPADATSGAASLDDFGGAIVVTGRAPAPRPDPPPRSPPPA